MMTIATLMGLAEARQDFLRKNQNTDGGWGYFPDKPSRVEPSAYALRALGAKDPAWQRGIAYLTARQDKSGGLTPGEGIPGSTWVTQLAFPLLKLGGMDKKNLERASDWIINTEGAEGGILQRLLYSMGKSKVDQDPKLKGWPWRPDNNSWVEPTAHGLLALHWMKDIALDAGIRYRRDYATRMLLDRRCLDGGWNYGNKKVLNEVLPSFPETTGLALLGLASSGADLSVSLTKAKDDLVKTKGAYGRALLTLALKLHGQRVDFHSDYPEGHPSRNLMLAGLEVMAARGTSENILP
jgi:hypothetical protein